MGSTQAAAVTLVAAAPQVDCMKGQGQDVLAIR